MPFMGRNSINLEHEFRKTKEFGETILESIDGVASGLAALIYLTLWQGFFSATSTLIDIHFVIIMIIRSMGFFGEFVITLSIYGCAQVLIHFASLANRPKEYINLHINYFKSLYKNYMDQHSGINNSEHQPSSSNNTSDNEEEYFDPSDNLLRQVLENCHNRANGIKRRV